MPTKFTPTKLLQKDFASFTGSGIGDGEETVVAAKTISSGLGLGRGESLGDGLGLGFFITIIEGDGVYKAGLGEDDTFGIGEDEAFGLVLDDRLDEGLGLELGGLGEGLGEGATLELLLVKFLVGEEKTTQLADPSVCLPPDCPGEGAGKSPPLSPYPTSLITTVSSETRTIFIKSPVLLSLFDQVKVTNSFTETVPDRVRLFVLPSLNL
ncbi:MAG: hypothetical protein G01um10145_697 [Microgenomates group bacterium Gr01-1014_5]|nr:MAG: hypothetical protein G01um10145_697 [Microgenomates group bacterium Gr01-1014_5]